MPSLAARLAALEEHFNTAECRCTPITVLVESADSLLTQDQVDQGLAEMPQCPVHARTSELVVIVRRYSVAHRPSM